jgi:hypothetical protein
MLRGSRYQCTHSHEGSWRSSLSPT